MDLEVKWLKFSKALGPLGINLKPAVNVAAAFIGMADGAETKNPQVAQATTSTLKLYTRRKDFIIDVYALELIMLESYVNHFK